MVATTWRYFDDLDALLASMPLGQIDMQRIDENERRHGHRFADPPEMIYQWLLDRQRRAQPTNVRSAAIDGRALPC